MANSIQIAKPSLPSLADLPSAFADWSHAMTNLHRLYKLLTETIAKRRHQPYALRYQLARSVKQPILSDLTRIRIMTVRELSWLENDIDEPAAVNQESALVFIERLRSHTIRLQKQATQIQRVLELRKPKRQNFTLFGQTAKLPFRRV